MFVCVCVCVCVYVHVCVCVYVCVCACVCVLELAAAAEVQVRRCTETSGLDRRGERERAQELHHAGTCNGRGMAADSKLEGFPLLEKID